MVKSKIIAAEIATHIGIQMSRSRQKWKITVVENNYKKSHFTTLRAKRATFNLTLPKIIRKYNIQTARFWRENLNVLQIIL